MSDAGVSGQGPSWCSRSAASSWALSWRSAGLQALDHEHAGQEELAAGVLLATRGADGDAPGRDDAPAELLPGLGVDDRDAGVEDHALGQHGPLPHPGALGHHAAAADVGVVAHHDRRGVGWLEHPADTDSSRQVDAGADLGARAHRGPGVDHGVGTDAGPDVDVARHEDDAPIEERSPARRCAGDAPGHRPPRSPS